MWQLVMLKHKFHTISKIRHLGMSTCMGCTHKIHNWFLLFFFVIFCCFFGCFLFFVFLNQHQTWHHFHQALKGNRLYKWTQSSRTFCDTLHMILHENHQTYTFLHIYMERVIKHSLDYTFSHSLCMCEACAQPHSFSVRLHGLCTVTNFLSLHFHAWCTVIISLSRSVSFFLGLHEMCSGKLSLSLSLSFSERLHALYSTATSLSFSLSHSLSLILHGWCTIINSLFPTLSLSLCAFAWSVHRHKLSHPFSQCIA